jgi:PHD/YefM family antitoxin component YafN of YafNO toxin-antitoxin module
MITSVSTHQARREFSQLLEQVHYTDQSVEIRRNKRPMAWLVGTDFIERYNKLIEYISEHKPGLAETLAVMLDDDLMRTLREGRAAVAKGETLPIESIFDD